MSLTAPYANSMRLGQGFNTYTQGIRIENAVKFLNKTVAPSDKPHALPTGIPSQPDACSKDVKPDGSSSQTKATNGPTQSLTDGNLETSFSNAKLVSEADDVLVQHKEDILMAFDLPATPPPNVGQSVTYSTRAIENVSDIMDALNISAATSIKYGTIHGNASAAFVNEGKVLDSQLNYVVSVKVNNNTTLEPEEMEFQPMEGIKPAQFTPIYGDSFISGFIEGGEFNAIISVNVHDKRKLRTVKQAIDLQLAMGPSPVSVEAKESFDKHHAELLQDTEITISVNWSGGGEIKRPDVPWTLSSVAQVANAFPSMVSRCPAKTSAVLTQYTALRTFQEWRCKMAEKDKEWEGKNVILNYAPCALYTTDLFDALMAYKKLWKKIDYIMSDTSKWKVREPQKCLPASASSQIPPIQFQKARNGQIFASPTSPADGKVNNINPAPAAAGKSQEDLCHAGSPGRADTFSVDDPLIQLNWDLQHNNDTRDPIPLDPVALNEARLLCREAMTLIIEEAAHLVDHPDLAYAKFDGETGKTRMRRPNYAYPEVLKARLPVYIGNDAADDSFARDATSVILQTFSRGNNLFSHIVGDVPNPHRKYKSFVSLTLNEGHGSVNPLCGLSLHAYRHHHWIPGHFSHDSDNAIGAIGFHFVGNKDTKADGCSEFFGKPHFDDATKWHSLDLAGKQISLPNPLAPKPTNRSPTNPHQHPSPTQPAAQAASTPTIIDIARIDVAYVPGSGRIAGLTLYELGDTAIERLTWKQWSPAGKEPYGLKIESQVPPVDDGRWHFVGLCGELDETIWGSVLSRVGGIWRRA